MDTLFGKLLDKVSKKQIISVMAMAIIYYAPLPDGVMAELLALLYLSKIVCITVIAGFAVICQYKIDVKENPNGKKDIPVVSVAVDPDGGMPRTAIESSP